MTVEHSKAGAVHDAVHGTSEDHQPAPVPRDPDLPSISSASVAFIAAGALLVVLVALFALFG